MIPRRQKTEAIIAHHSQADGLQRVEEITAFHTRAKDATRIEGGKVVPWPGNGWTANGYHKIVDALGRVYDGRALDLEGAHCLGWNDRSVGVCLLGNFDLHDPPPAQLAAAFEVFADLITIYPGAKLIGHRQAMILARLDPGNRTCPGVRLKPWIEAAAHQLEAQEPVGMDELYV